MRKILSIIAFAVCAIANGQIDFSDKSNFVDPGEIVESADFSCPYKTTLDFAVISQTADLNDAAGLRNGITCVIDFLYLSPNESKLTFSVYDEANNIIGERRWRNVKLHMQKFENGSTGYEITDETNTYSYARIRPNIKGNKYWCFFNPLLVRDVL